MQLSSQKCISVGKQFSHGFKQVFSTALIHHMPALLRISHAARGRVGIHLASAIQKWGFKPKFTVMVPWWFGGRLAPAAPAPPLAPSGKMLCVQLTAVRGRHSCCPVLAVPPSVRLFLLPALSALCLHYLLKYILAREQSAIPLCKHLI